MENELTAQRSQRRAGPTSRHWNKELQVNMAQLDSIAAHRSSLVPSTVRGASATASVKGRFVLIQSVVKHDPIPIWLLEMI